MGAIKPVGSPFVDEVRFHHIGIGNAYAGWRVAMLIDGLDIEIVGLDGSPLRRLVLEANQGLPAHPLSDGPG